MKISVIIPSYKPGDYIWECLDSLDNQTLNHEDFEVIIILNGCSEPWKSQISEYITQHTGTNFRLLQTDQGGVSNARNIGLDNAKGEYIAFVDDDDCVSKHYLDGLLALSSPECVALTDAVYFDDKSNSLNYDNIHHKEYQRLGVCTNPSIYQARRFFNGPCMKLVHKDIIGSRRFDCRFANGEDNLMMFYISDRIQNVVMASSEAIYFRRIRSNSATTRHRNRWQVAKNTFRIMRQYVIYLSKNIFGYNVPFVLSRFVAEIKSIIVR